MGNYDMTKHPLDAEAISGATYRLCVTFNGMFARMVDAISSVSNSLSLLSKALLEESNAMAWAADNAPKIYHLSKFGRTQRVRKKNKKRIVALYKEEMT